MLADLRWLGLDWDEGPDKGGEVRTNEHARAVLASSQTAPAGNV